MTNLRSNSHHWVYRLGGVFDDEHVGPVTEEELILEVRSGKLRMQTPVWSQTRTNGQWVSLNTVPELLYAFEEWKTEVEEHKIQRRECLRIRLAKLFSSMQLVVRSVALTSWLLSRQLTSMLWVFLHRTFLFSALGILSFLVLLATITILLRPTSIVLEAGVLDSKSAVPNVSIWVVPIENVKTLDQLISRDLDHTRSKLESISFHRRYAVQEDSKLRPLELKKAGEKSETLRIFYQYEIDLTRISRDQFLAQMKVTELQMVRHHQEVIVLIENELRGLAFKNAKTGMNGIASIEDVPPGNYRLYVLPIHSHRQQIISEDVSLEIEHPKVDVILEFTDFPGSD